MPHAALSTPYRNDDRSGVSISTTLIFPSTVSRSSPTRFISRYGTPGISIARLRIRAPP